MLNVEFALADIAAFVEVVLIDLALAGDNAIAVGLAASALPAAQRKQAISLGVILALVLRVGLALLTVQLLEIRGLLLVGGLMLFWVAWRIVRDLQRHQADTADAEQAGSPQRSSSFAQALMSIVIADVSMSLDNVLAVAGVARHSPAILAFGLVLSVLLMAVAANFIAKVIGRHQWIAYVGVLVIVFAGFQMAWEDLHHFFPQRIPAMPSLHGAEGALAR